VIQQPNFIASPFLFRLFHTSADGPEFEVLRGASALAVCSKAS